MDNEDLIKTLKQYPKTARIYVESDHGQSPEQSGAVNVCTEKLKELPYNGDELNWRDTKDVDPKDVTAINIR